MHTQSWHIIGLVVVLFGLTACNVYKYVPEDEYLLRSTKVKTDLPKESMENVSIKAYLRQTPNARMLGVWPITLQLYSLSGRKDSTRWVNRFLRHKVGSAPVIYASADTRRSERELRQFAVSKGFSDAEVTSEVIIKDKYKKMPYPLTKQAARDSLIDPDDRLPAPRKLKVHKGKAWVEYTVRSNEPYRLRDFSFRCRNDDIKQIVERDSAKSLIKKGMLFDLDVLDAERERIVTLLRRQGYYDFSKEYMRFVADSTVGTREVDLRLMIRSRLRRVDEETNEDLSVDLKKYTVDRIVFYASYDPITGTSGSGLDSVKCCDYTVYYRDKLRFRPQVLGANCHITPHGLYNEEEVEKTYTALNLMPAIRYVDIRFRKDEERENSLDCIVLVSPAIQQSYSVDVEGTNSNGDLGFAGIVSYQHKNIFHGSEILKVSLKYTRETETGSLSDLLRHTSNEIEGNVSVTFPQFLFPFLKPDFRRKIRAYTEFSTGYNYQRRAEFARTYATGNIKYSWTSHGVRRQTFDLLDIGYIYLPYISDAFRERYLNSNSILKYSYENQLIVGCGYSFSIGNQPVKRLKDKYTVRIAVETAGNLLYGLANAFDFRHNEGGYMIGKIRFAEYVRGTFDFAYDKYISKKHNVVFHFGTGVACPYGNADAVPFEKRFISGGANSVRGWTVRRLGPGVYRNADYIDYMNQSGDIKIDLNLEYRFKMFWRFEGALFVDGGNIWTIFDYNTQPGGQFRWNKFYKQMAMGYGAGLRMDFTYFLIRFDLGLKGYDPSTGEWRFKGFRWKDDKSLHFAIGYPF